jgi:hypothetical protein
MDRGRPALRPSTTLVIDSTHEDLIPRPSTGPPILQTGGHDLSAGPFTVSDRAKRDLEHKRQTLYDGDAEFYPV